MSAHGGKPREEARRTPSARSYGIVVPRCLSAVVLFIDTSFAPIPPRTCFSFCTSFTEQTPEIVVLVVKQVLEASGKLLQMTLLDILTECVLGLQNGAGPPFKC